jgi:hypothetical protein
LIDIFEEGQFVGFAFLIFRAWAELFGPKLEEK